MPLFVYGSLRRDREGRHHPLLHLARFVGPATVAGHLYRVSWHPGLKVGPNGSRVHGELFEFGDADREAAMAALDVYEGDDFRLVPLRARLADGQEVDAHTYEWLGDSVAATLLPDGEWGPHAGHPAST